MNPESPPSAEGSGHRAAAVAGILFAVLFSASMLLIRLVLPEELAGPMPWLEKNTSLITLALTLVPFTASPSCGSWAWCAPTWANWKTNSFQPSCSGARCSFWG